MDSNMERKDSLQHGTAVSFCNPDVNPKGLAPLTLNGSFVDL